MSTEIKLAVQPVGIKAMVGRRMTKTVKFMEENITISKLSVAEVLDIQEQAKAAEEDDSKGFDIQKNIIANAVEGGKDLTDEDFRGFPMEELSKLSSEIMKFSGMGEQKGK